MWKLQNSKIWILQTQILNSHIYIIIFGKKNFGLSIVFVFPTLLVGHQENMHIAIVLVFFLWNIVYVSDNESTPTNRTTRTYIILEHLFLHGPDFGIFRILHSFFLFFRFALICYVFLGASKIHAHCKCFGALSLEHIVLILIADSLCDLL